MEKLISFIIPAYNAEATIARAVRSIVCNGADRRKIEVLIVEDHAQDHTLEVAKRLEKRYHSCVRVLQSEAGVSNARNMGIDESAGKWIVFVDADDYIRKGKMELLLEDAEKEKADLVAYSYRAGDKTVRRSRSQSVTYMGPKVETARARMLMQPTRCMQVWGHLFRASVIRDNHIRFNPALRLSEDSEFMIRVTSHCRSIRYDSSVLYHYSTNNASTMRTYDGTKKLAYLESLKAAYKDMEGESETIRNAFVVYALMQFNLAMVREVFAVEHEAPVVQKIEEMKALASADLFERAIREISIAACSSRPSLIPILMLKFHRYTAAAAIYSARARHNFLKECTQEKNS